MGMFSAILDKLRDHGRGHESVTSAQAPSGGTAPASTGQPTSAATPAPAQAQAAAPAVLKDVDMEAVLKNLAQQRGGSGNYQSSIVNLLKLLDLDSSLKARTELADELGVHGSAEQNIALHKAVMRKLAENGGKVPASMKN